MTVERREEITEVVRYDTTVVEPVAVTTYQTEAVTGNPYVVQGIDVLKLQQIIFMVFGILEGLLFIRFVLGVLGANPAAGFAQLIYGTTAPFLAPFVGLFGQPSYGGMVFEWNALVAILVYVLLAGLIAKLLAFVINNQRSSTITSTTTRIG